MTLLLFLTIVFIAHFIADFILQSREMAQQKSQDFLVLAEHLMTIDVVITIATIAPFIVHYGVIKGVLATLVFSFLNGVIHGVIDWNIWRAYKWSTLRWMRYNRDHESVRRYRATGVFPYWEDTIFYHTIGFDQLLHGLTLIGLAFLFWR